MELTEIDSGGEPERAMAWLRSRLDELGDVPLPGGGDTLSRWQYLASLARGDLSVARLAEGHLDALAILAELGRPDLGDGGCLGVWAAEPERLRAFRTDDGWHLSGEKRWCSGSSSLDRALVVATAPDGPRLFAVDTAGLRVEPDSWRPIAMAATASETILFDDVVGPDAAVGRPHEYVERPGFWAGSMGVAACWFGGTVGVADLLAEHVAAREPSPLSTAACGRVRVHLDGCADRLRTAAGWLDRCHHPSDEIHRRAVSLRLTAEAAARAVIEEVTLVGGASALAFDPGHARRVGDLTMYVRQLDRFRNEQAMGDLASGRWTW